MKCRGVVPSGSTSRSDVREDFAFRKTARQSISHHHRKITHLQQGAFFLPKWAGKFGPCSSAASVTDVQVRSFSTSYRKTRIFLAPFGKKCRSSGRVPVGFSHGRAAPAGTAHCAMSILRAGLTGHIGNTRNGTWHRVCHVPSKCQSTWLSVSFVPLP